MSRALLALVRHRISSLDDCAVRAAYIEIIYSRHAIPAPFALLWTELEETFGGHAGAQRVVAHQLRIAINDARG